VVSAEHLVDLGVQHQLDAVGGQAGLNQLGHVLV
jgi:hypothetical protein